MPEDDQRPYPAVGPPVWSVSDEELGSRPSGLCLAPPVWSVSDEELGSRTLLPAVGPLCVEISLIPSYSSIIPVVPPTDIAGALGCGCPPSANYPG